MAKRKTTEEFYGECKSIGIEPLAGQEYKGVGHKMNFYCVHCGQPFERGVREVLYGKQHQCWDCRNKGHRKMFALSTKEFYEKCKEIGALPLEGQTYINNSTKMLFRCANCGEIVEKTFKKVYYSKQTKCKHCADIEGGKKKKGKYGLKGEANPMYGKCGKEHPCYNPDKDRTWRDTTKYNEIMKIAKKNDNYTCQITGKQGNIVSHHVFAGCKYKHLQYELNNLVTLNRELHMQYHLFTGGTRNADKNVNLTTFLEFLETFKGTEHEQRCKKLAATLSERLGGIQ